MAEVIPISGRDQPERCRAATGSGRRCRNRAVTAGYCRVHLRAAEPPGELEDGLQRALAFLRRRLTGEYEVDEFGFDPDLTENVLAPLARVLHRRWWRVDWVGMDRVPARGGALLVANHAGTLPWDAIVMKFGVLDNHPAHRHVRLLAADLAFGMPVVGPLARKSGNTLATEQDALRLLERGDLLGVFPEGYKGVGKPFKERYKLQRFGRGGFIELALRTRVPIVPAAIVGSEEILPMLYNAKTLARILGFPYFPVTPFFPWLGPLGLVPLPSKWHVEFGEPIATDGFPDDAWQDALTVFDLTDRVREEIQQMLYRNVMARRSVWY
ncbi:MAG TPA: 1-acyl-sn-glycerol-3-phosphate acyltransferase [Actinomycetota bacterium]|nr:1-acyl-sn-glycerol-3-phosphate acyltransferase [Actinomycetota bacterium]